MLKLRHIVFCCFLFVFPCFALIFDNRFFPLIQKPIITIDDRPSYVTLDFFATKATRAIGKDKNEIGLPGLFGLYDQGELAQSFVLAGCPNPLKSEWQGKKIPWRLDGNIKAEGFTFAYRQAFKNIFAFGFNGYFMQMDSSQDFYLTKDAKQNLNLTTSGIIELDDTRRAMHKALGLHGNHYGSSSMGDLECYLRVWNRADYILRCRRIWAGLNGGIIFPISFAREIDYPAAVPFGGDGHWGAYISGDAEFEVKEDLKCGALLRLSKRFKQIATKRVPLGNEPYIFGVYRGKESVDPGVTFVFSPYVSMEGLRDGLGIQVQYTLTYHEEDLWLDCRPIEKQNELPLQSVNVTKSLEWSSDYISLNMFYDFGKMKIDRAFYPIVRFSWDIPASILVAENVCKTNKVSLGIECNF